MVNEGSKRGQKSEQIRRLLLTAFLYLMFGVGALVVSWLIILPLVIISKDPQQRVRRVRWVNRLAFSAFTRCGITLGVFAVSFVDVHKLNQPGQLIIANHPSLLDVVFLLARIPNANCVVKKKLLRNPFLALPVYFADYILNDDGDRFLQNCIVSLERGESIVIFPEGTRTTGNESYQFKRGAAYLMLMSNCPVRPVYISCQPPALSGKTPWHVVPERKIAYCFTVMAELDVSSMRHAQQIRLPLKSRWLTKYLVGWYGKMDRGEPYRDCGKIKIPATWGNSTG